MPPKTPASLTTDKKQYTVYREIFFAGFRHANTKSGSAAAGEGDEADESYYDGLTSEERKYKKEVERFWDSSRVFSFFRHYGEVTSFIFEEDSGVGSVVFADGEQAERCYLALHLSSLPDPAAMAGGGHNNTSSGGGGAAAGSSDLSRRNHNYIIYLEFAQACPFVNPLLLLWGRKRNHPEVALTEEDAEQRKDEKENEDDSASKQKTKAKKKKNDRSEEEREEARRVFFHCGQVSRELLRHLPIASEPPAAANSSGGNKAVISAGVSRNKGTAEWVVYYPPSSSAEGATTSDTNTAARLSFPLFAGQAVSHFPSALLQRMWILLKPEEDESSGTTGRGRRSPVRVLDLWYSYYNSYVLRKTQPDVTKVGEDFFLAAVKPSPLQEVKRLFSDDFLDEEEDVQKDTNSNRNTKEGKESKQQKIAKLRKMAKQETQSTLRRRFVEDDIFHNTLTFLSLKVNFEHDPVFTSFMRDFFASSTQKRDLKVNAKYTKVIADYIDVDKGTVWEDKPVLVFFTAMAQRCQQPPSKAKGKGNSASNQEESEDNNKKPTKKQGKAFRQVFEEVNEDALNLRKQWIYLPLLKATSNLIENVKFLRKVQRKEVDKDGNEMDSKEIQKKKEEREKNDSTNFNDNPIDYPTGTLRQQEEDFFSELMQTLNGFAPNGRLTQLLSMVEDTALFRGVKGHIGYDELHPPTQFWVYLNALWVPLIVLLLASYGYSYFGNKYLTPQIEKYNRRREELAEQRRLNATRNSNFNSTKDGFDPFAPPGGNGGDPKKQFMTIEEHKKRMKELEEMIRKRGGKINVRLAADL